MQQRSQKVLVALSGGVDSSVAAALLQEQGHVVEGAFIVTWQAPWLPCTWREERRDAMRVAAHLDIPFHTVNLAKEYERDVVTYFVEEYQRGRTPNPDVMCNKHVKFGGFFDWAMRHGFDTIATGHYAQILHHQGTYMLHAGVDTNKDQSYFLWTLTQDHLAHTLFPVGVYDKPNVRTLAKHYNLPTAHKKDSQGVCFLGKVDMKSFLAHYIPPHPGDVLDTTGKPIGRHDGTAYYTLGQRHGFTITRKGPNTPPLFVTSKDMNRNTITVAPRPNTEDAHVASARQTLVLEHTNWINNAPEQGTKVTARLRYRQPLWPATLTAQSATSCSITPTTPQPYLPLGQSVVLYQADRCLGGGVLTNATHSTQA